MEIIRRPIRRQNMSSPFGRVPTFMELELGRFCWLSAGSGADERGIENGEIVWQRSSGH